MPESSAWSSGCGRISSLAGTLFALHNARSTGKYPCQPFRRPSSAGRPGRVRPCVAMREQLGLPLRVLRTEPSLHLPPPPGCRRCSPHPFALRHCLRRRREAYPGLLDRPGRRIWRSQVPSRAAGSPSSAVRLLDVSSWSPSATQWPCCPNSTASSP